MDVSIVIVSYNTSMLLDGCIQSIQKETRCSYKIIVVDNASTDGSCRMVREKHPRVTLIENRENVGFARANNQGFAVAQGRYFFMLNPDTVIQDKAIDKLVDFMDSNPDVGICGPRNVGPDGILQYNCDHFPSIWNSFCSYVNLKNIFPGRKVFQRSRMEYWDYSEARSVEKIMGCSLLMRSDLYYRLQGLDTHFFMYFEETDLCYRAVHNGYRIVFFPNATIIHYGGESSRTLDEKHVINKTISSYFLASQYYFYRKNYGFLRMLLIRCLDFSYGLTLIMKNTFRKDRVERNHRILKGKKLCFSAISIENHATD